MTRAREHLVCLSATPFYHVTSRCVRRAFLCGVDRDSGKSYEHRRGWIEDRVRVLASLFSIQLCAYAVMSNHYHLVVKLCPEASRDWSDDEVLTRWTSLFRGPLLVQRYRAGAPLSDPERDTVRDLVGVYRGRLASLSWFMKCLNEPIARQANAEDRCTGHFWEARFSSQSLCSQRALLTAMAYVDLNPIRAGMAQVPEQSHYTSIKARIEGDTRGGLTKAASRLLQRNELRHFHVPIRPLMPFADPAQPAVLGSQDDVLPMVVSDYLRLVDTTGRIVRTGKRGCTDPSLTPILERLGLTPEQWTDASTGFRGLYRKGDLRLKQTA
jgi:REP element-mobilizing transposase RayT